MLIYGETPAERKASIMQNIALNRELIPLMTKANTTGEFSESIAILRQEIKDNFNDLVELKRLQRKEGYEDHQAYIPPSLKAKKKGT